MDTFVDHCQSQAVTIGQKAAILLAIMRFEIAWGAPGADTITVQPARDDAMLLNPGKGWVQYYGADQ